MKQQHNDTKQMMFALHVKKNRREKNLLIIDIYSERN